MQVMFLHAVIDAAEQVHARSTEPVPKNEKRINTCPGNRLQSERISQGGDEEIISPIYLLEN
jgi:hypothetical protein